MAKQATRHEPYSSQGYVIQIDTYKLKNGKYHAFYSINGGPGGSCEGDYPSEQSAHNEAMRAAKQAIDYYRDRNTASS